MEIKVIKRNGSIVDFDGSKIKNAIQKAAKELMMREEILDVYDNVMYKIYGIAVGGKKEISVEEIQDLVEKELISLNYSDVAKKYIIYRQERKKIRDTRNYLMETFNKITFSDSKDEDIKRENGNIDTDSSMGVMLKYGTTASNFYVDNFILPKKIADAHSSGDIHIHDKDFFMLTETCCQIDLLKLFKNGFSTGHGFLREPNSISTAAALCCIAIQANQNEMYGAMQ